MIKTWSPLSTVLLSVIALGAASCGGNGSSASSGAGGASSGSGGATSSSSASGAGGATSSSSAGGGGGSVCDPASCPPPSSECVDAFCDASNHCAEKPKPDGTVAATQTPGDCKHNVCQGGVVAVENDDSDIADDMNECTDDTCSGGVASHPVKALDTPCGPGGNSFCDGAGTCAECNTPMQCAGQDTECQYRTCNAGVCGVAFKPKGTLTMSQVMGDCQQNQCDGMGAIETAPDATDIQDDGNPCTSDACNGNAPIHPPLPVNTPCGGGNKCDGAGMCVGCITAADCQAPANACLVATCVAGMCGTANKPNGTACNDNNACTQTDTCQSGTCTGSNPVICSAIDQCHNAGSCDPGTGTCSNPNKPNGTACSDNNACTQTDTCQFGACTGSNPVVCSALDQCHNAGSCNANTGMCSNPNKADGTACTLNGMAGTCGSGACSVCGNGTVEGSEQCDDGNATPCDGCSPKCQLDTSITYASAAGLNVSIPDDGYNGTVASMACVNVTVVASGDNVVDYVCPTLAVTHTWIGDLTIKVISPANTVVTLMSMPGVVEAADNGASVTGDSSNLLASFPITWKDGGPKSAENMGNTLANSGVVCRDDMVCVYDPNNGAAAAGKLASFIGQAGPGTWKVCVGDSGLGDLGTIDQVKLVIGQ